MPVKEYKHLIIQRQLVPIKRL